VLWLLAVSCRTFVQVRSFLHSGAGDYSSREWQESETIAYLRNRDVREPVFSNVPKAVYILTGKQASAPPGWPPYAGPAGIGHAGPREFQSHAPSEEGWTLVWFGEADVAGLYDPGNLAGFSSIERIAVLSDGSVYSLRAVPPDSPQGSWTP
jgi:hypothetical protein